MAEKLENLLTIDPAAHLEKVSSFSFRSASHYPVELVRSSLRRGAREVSIACGLTLLQLSDEGDGIDPRLLELLGIAACKSLPENDREEALEKLRDSEGSTIFAIFAANPERVTIENARGQEKTTMTIAGGEARCESSAGIESGTRITIRRRSVNFRKEISLLRDYCRAANARITINGKTLAKSSLLSGFLAARQNSFQDSPVLSEIAIPLRGELCQIVLTDQGIPHRLQTIPPRSGLIFEAIVEERRRLPEELLDTLAKQARELYEEMLAGLADDPPARRERKLELLYRHHQLTGSSDLADRFLSFRAVRVPTPLTLGQIRRLAGNHPIYTIDRAADESRYNAYNRIILKLDRRDRDFLAGQAGIKLVYAQPLKGTWRRFAAWVAGRAAALSNRLAAGRASPARRIVSLEELQAGEKLFLETLWLYLKKNPRLLGLPPGSEAIRVVLTAAGRSRPLYAENSGGSIRVMVNREHPLVARLIAKPGSVPEAVELISHLL